MSLVKLNVFHWYVRCTLARSRLNGLISRHITDSNSWPLDLDRYPEIAAKGAYSPAQRYSQTEVQQLIDYAAEVRLPIHATGGRVVPLAIQRVSELILSSAASTL